MKKIIYCLTHRGMYSELLYLALAKVYADSYGYELLVNTNMWNSSLEKGLADWFIPYFKNTNNILTQQYRIYTDEHPWIGKIYYDPFFFLTYWKFWLFNKIYKTMHPTSLLSRDVYKRMRSNEFLDKFSTEDLLQAISNVFKRFYVYNDDTMKYIVEKKARLGIPVKYIAIHVRRGDKIRTGEMDFLDLPIYMDKLREFLHISRNVYIATDDVSIIQYFQKEFKQHDINLYYNADNVQNGFDEKTYNLKSKKTKRDDVLNILFDMDIMIHSSFFIGTFSSNVGKVVPLYLGLDNCCSIDENWFIIG
ncbi:MAG: glycosyl transferase [Prevotella sp.]